MPRRLRLSFFGRSRLSPLITAGSLVGTPVIAKPNRTDNSCLTIDTYSDITKRATLEWRLQRAGITLAIQQNVLPETLSEKHYRYWVEVDGARYHQIQVRAFFCCVAHSRLRL